MIVYPAIDLRHGRCVRLEQGNAAAETVFADDPVLAAERWLAEGAEWLHVVNLDGALGEAGAENQVALGRIISASSVPVQFGGGIRSLTDIEMLLGIGVARVILGTVAVRDPGIVSDAIVRHGPTCIAVGLDARDGRVLIHGWQEATPLTAADLADQMAGLGVERIVYTDVARDGMLVGPSFSATEELARSSSLRVIASGGVSSVTDVRRLSELETYGVDGVITGMAIYTGKMSLAKAIRAARGEN